VVSAHDVRGKVEISIRNKKVRLVRLAEGRLDVANDH